MLRNLRWGMMLCLLLVMGSVKAGASEQRVAYDNSNLLTEKWAQDGLLKPGEKLSFKTQDWMNILRDHHGDSKFYMRGELIELSNEGGAAELFSIFSGKIVAIMLIASIISVLGALVSLAYLSKAKDLESMIFFCFNIFLISHNSLTFVSSYFGYLFYYLTTSFAIKLLNQRYIRAHFAVDALFALGVAVAFSRDDTGLLKHIGNINYLNGLLLLYLCIHNIKNRKKTLISSNMIFCFLVNTVNSVINYPLVIIGFAFYVPYILMQSYLLISNSVVNERQAVENEKKALDSLAIVSEQKNEIQEKNTLLAQKQKELTSLNEHLEDLVKEKTQDIKGLLNNVELGICSIAPDLRISKDYSAYLPKIIGRSPDAHTTIDQLFLDHILASRDAVDTYRNVLANSLGETELTFMVNKGNLPDQVQYHDKILKCNWSTSVNDQAVVEKILLVLNDVTQEVAQERLLREKEVYFTKIKELVDAKEEKSNAFFATSKVLMDKVLLVINKAYITMDDLDEIYVCYHTIKGASRTLGFKSISNTIHDCESQISLWRQENAGRKGPLKLDVRELKQNYELALQQYNEYWTINKDDLNRSDDYEHVKVHKQFVMEQYQVLEEAYRQLSTQEFDRDMIVQSILSHKNKIINFISVSLEKAFDDYKEIASKLALELKKNKPMFQFKVQDHYLDEATKQMLDSVFVHLLRNALDHGIESNAERLAAGKPDYGTLFVDAKVDKQAGRIRIQLSDDGRGLAIGKLRKIGLEKGTLTPESSLEEVANSIFASGVSTAKQVSDISGRGVGMDAVRRFLNDRGGDIHIVLMQAHDASGEYFNFQFVLEFPFQQEKKLSQAS